MIIKPPLSELEAIAKEWEVSEYPQSMNVTLSENGRALLADQPAFLEDPGRKIGPVQTDKVINPVHYWLFAGEFAATGRYSQVLANLQQLQA